MTAHFEHECFNTHGITQKAAILKGSNKLEICYVLYDTILATITKPKGLGLSQILEQEVHLHLYKTKGRLFPSMDSRKLLCCWQQMRQHLIVSTGATAAMLHGPLCTGHSTILHPQQQNMSYIYLNI
jgi:hypothetical protein